MCFAFRRIRLLTFAARIARRCPVATSSRAMPSPPAKLAAKRIALAAAMLLLAGSAANARDLRVCADPNNLPFSNDRGEGFENRLAELIARDLNARLTYVWQAQRRGFLRETLKAGRCDLVPGIMAEVEMLRTTVPYYRSTYAFVTRAGETEIASLDDPALRRLRVGVQLIGDDGSNTPPAHSLSRRGIVDNVRGYMIYGDYAEPNPPARIIEAVALGEIDVAIAWGPLAGYFAPRQKTPLVLTPVTPQADGPRLPMVFDIALGVRKEDAPFRDELNGLINRHRAEIDTLLASYGVPRLDAVSVQQAGRLP
jgi:mxaJ protein